VHAEEEAWQQKHLTPPACNIDPHSTKPKPTNTTTKEQQEMSDDELDSDSDIVIRQQ
jgi:hypothetical protein